MTTATISVDHVTRAIGRRRGSRPQPLFRDVETAPVWMRLLGGTLLLGGAILVAAILGWPGDGPELALIVPGAVGVVVGLLLLSARSGLTIDGSIVRLHFRPLPARSIPRDRIVAARIVEADGRDNGGIGLRFGLRRRSLMLTAGIGVEITDARGRRTFVRVGRPEDAIRALRPTV